MRSSSLDILTSMKLLLSIGSVDSILIEEAAWKLVLVTNQPQALQYILTIFKSTGEPSALPRFHECCCHPLGHGLPGSI